MANTPPEFDPMADLSSALNAHFNGEFPPLEVPPLPGAETAETDDGPPVVPIIIAGGSVADLIAILAGKKPAGGSPNIGHVSVPVLEDLDDEHGTIYDACERAGGTMLQLMAQDIPADGHAELHGLTGRHFITSLLFLGRAGWYLVVDVDVDGDPDHARRAAVPITRVSHLMWHALAGKGCSGGGLVLPGQAASTDTDGKSARDYLSAALEAIVSVDPGAVNEREKGTARAIAKALDLLPGAAI